MIKEDKFLEHAEVLEINMEHLKSPIIEKLSKGKDILFDIDWQGTQELKKKSQNI